MNTSGKFIWRQAAEERRECDTKNKEHKQCHGKLKYNLTSEKKIQFICMLFSFFHGFLITNEKRVLSLWTGFQFSNMVVSIVGNCGGSVDLFSSFRNFCFITL